MPAFDVPLLAVLAIVMLQLIHDAVELDLLAGVLLPSLVILVRLKSNMQLREWKQTARLSGMVAYDYCAEQQSC
ncbi:MAG: hypothetical protein ACJ8FY_02760 [Gemmataceae bacterium]